MIATINPINKIVSNIIYFIILFFNRQTSFTIYLINIDIIYNSSIKNQPKLQ